MDGKGTFDIVLLSTISFLLISSDMITFGLGIDPEDFQVPKLGLVTVNCYSDSSTPISSCQFRILYVDKKEYGPLLNVTEAEKRTVITVPNPHQPSSNYTARLFVGKINNEILCAARFFNLDGDQLVISCQMTTDTKLCVWNMPLFFNKASIREPLTISSRSFTQDCIDTAKNKTSTSIFGPPTDLISTNPTGDTVSSRDPLTQRRFPQVGQEITTTNPSTSVFGSPLNLFTTNPTEETGKVADVLFLHLTIVYVILAALAAMTAGGGIYYAKQKQRCCFKVESRKATPEPIYEEIKDAMTLSPLPSPSQPSRYFTRDVHQMEVPEDQAPDRPVVPKRYINLEIADDSIDDEGYMKPIA